MISAANTRKRIRKHRQSLTPAECQQYATAACKQLVQLSSFRNAMRIAMYLPANGELDPLPALQKATDIGKTCYLPVLHPIQQKLWFAPWKPGDPLGSNKFGIPEPKLLFGEMIPPWALDLVLTPLVAFDNYGTRLGMGGGYYDRSFSYLNLRRYFRRPMLIGYGYEFQRVSKLKRHHWDIPVHMAVTDQHSYKFTFSP